MITKEVLDALGAMAVAAGSPPMHQLTSGIPFVYLPAGVESKSMEGYLPAPTRFRGTYTTRRASDFAAYVALNHVEDDDTVPDTRIFVDPDTMKATAHFGLGNHADPGWGDHVANLAPRMLPAFSALLANANERTGAGEKPKEHTQQQMLEFFRDWRECVTFTDDSGKVISFAAAIAAISSAKVTSKAELESSIESHGNRVSALEESSRRAMTGDKLPTAFTFTCPPYDEIDDFEFECALRSESRGTVITFMYRIDALEARKLEIADAFVALLRDNLNSNDCERLADDTRVGVFSRK